MALLRIDCRRRLISPIEYEDTQVQTFENFVIVVTNSIIMENNALTKEITKTLFFSVIALTLVPGIAWYFTSYVLSQYRLSASEFVQFDWVHTTSFWMLIAAAALLCVVLLLCALAFSNRSIQYISFVTGWRLVVFFCIIELLLQGAIATWLSFWVTAVFTKSYFPKVILLVALAVGAGIFYAIVHIFKSLPKESSIEGVILSRADAPTLWKRVENISNKMNAKVPDHIFTGIDTNFFVTESPLTVNGKTIKGRTLFISLPLLRILSAEEADAVLAHELGHFRAGDTRNSALLWPKLQKCGYFLDRMYDNASTRIIYYPLCFYRLVFEVALQRESRRREFNADAAAAQTVSGKAVVHSLIKVAAYANYRAQVENQLFDNDERYEGNLGLADKIAQGLATYVSTNQFADDMEKNSIPHPFDSHPLLSERMSNVQSPVDKQNFAFIVTQKPVQTWIDDIPNADLIEQQQWQEYEQNFTKNHEEMLAFRYEPTGPEQEAIVLKYFPDVTFDLKKNQHITVSYRGIQTPEGDLYSWDAIKDMDYTDGSFSDTLILKLNKTEEKSKVKITLAGIKAQRDALKDAIGRFSYRHNVMLAMKKESAEKPPSSQQESVGTV